MSDLLALTGARIFDGRSFHDGQALLIAGDTVRAVTSGPLPPGCEICELDGGLLVPGLVDLQVNGGGGVLLNEAPTAQSIATICRTHARLGTTALLPTLVTDTPEVTGRALAAGAAAARAGVPGFLGLHLEGPHIAAVRKGAHDPALIRPMASADLEQLASARQLLPNLLVTLAAETVSPEQVRTLTASGVVISLGHSDASFEQAQAAFDAGAAMATHLFNAMSQLGSREPGLVGAVLSRPGAFAGLIADGIHVHPATMATALRAKAGPGRIFLVSDAMSVAGTDLTGFSLNGRMIHRRDGSLRLEDGTLAGADLTLLEAVRYAHRVLELALDEALRMASLYPARALGVADRLGHLEEGAVASLVHLSDGLDIRATWIAGQKVHEADPFRGQGGHSVEE